MEVVGDGDGGKWIEVGRVDAGCVRRCGDGGWGMCLCF